MRVFKRTPIRLVALAAALSLTFSLSAMAVGVNETDVPIEVGSLVTGTALGVGTISGVGVNVRNNPNMDAEVVTTLSQGTQVVVLSKDGNWYRISAEGLTGFVASNYMTVEAEGYSDLGYGEIKAAEGVLRSTADSDSESVGTITAEDVVKILGVSDGYYNVSVNGVEGYIRSDLVDPTVQISAERIYSYAVVNVNGINLRSAPDSASEKLDMLYNDSLCTLLEQDGDWYKVQYGDAVGYVLGSYMSTTNDEAEGSTELETANEVAAREAEEAAAARAAAEAAAAEAAAKAEAAAAEAAAKAAAAVAAAPSYSEPETSYSEPETSYSESETSYSESETSYSESETSYDDYEEESYSEPEYTYEEPAYNYSSGNEIINTAYNYLGVPYVWGGTSPYGFDCSGFVQYVFSSCGYSVTRTADTQYYDGSYVSYSNLQAGDLVFFCNTYSAAGITHVGIYIGGGDFIHCASGGVKISSLDESYYSSRYYAACRIV